MSATPAKKAAKRAAPKAKASFTDAYGNQVATAEEALESYQRKAEEAAAAEADVVDAEVTEPETWIGKDGVEYDTPEDALDSWNDVDDALPAEPTAIAAFVDDIPDDLSDIPEDMQFSTQRDESEEEEREFIEIALDGALRVKLYKPPVSAYMLLAGSLSSNADNADRMYAIQTLLNMSLEEKGRIYLKNRMLGPAGKTNYDDQILGKITDKIMTTWGDELDPNKNRAQKRAAAKAAKRNGAKR